jgi:N-acetylneuraminic acid mutarotase
MFTQKIQLVLLRCALLSLAPLAVKAAAVSTLEPLPVPYHSDSTETDTMVPSWPTVLGRLPRGITSFGACELDGWVYVLGGYFGVPHDYCLEYQSRDFYRLRADRPEYLELLPNESRLQGTCLVAWGQRVIRIGGLEIHNDASQPEDLRSIGEVRCFDPETMEWRWDLPDLPAPRSSHEAIVHGDHLYVAGGWLLSEEEPVWHSDVLVLDLRVPDQGWRSIPAPFKKRALALGVVEGQLVAFGGIHSSGTTTDDGLFALDLATQTWTRGAAFPGQAFAVSAAQGPGMLLASGRDGELLGLKSVQGPFLRLASWRHPRMFHRLVPSAAGQLLALGGIGSQGRPVAIESWDWSALLPQAELGAARALESAVDAWGLGVARQAAANPQASGSPEVAIGRHGRIQTLRLPYPGSAKNRQAMQLVGSELYFFGGNHSLEQHAFRAQDFCTEGWKLNLDTWEFARLEDYPVARQSMQLIRAGDQLLSVGGFGITAGPATSQAEAFLYDKQKDVWESKAVSPLPARSQFLLVEHQGQAWMFGGQRTAVDADGVSRTHYETAVYRTHNGLTSADFSPAGIDLPRARCAMAGACLDGKVYLVGGMREDFELVAGVDCLDLEQGSWSTCPAPWAPRLGARLVALNGRLYLIGGHTRSAAGELVPERTIEVLDPGQPAWLVYPERLPEEPRQIQAFAWNGRLLICTSHLAEAALQLTVVEPL